MYGALTILSLPRQGQQGFQQRGIMGGFRQQPQQQQQQPGLDQQQQQMQNDMKRNARLYNDIPAAVLQSLVRMPTHKHSMKPSLPKRKGCSRRHTVIV